MEGTERVRLFVVTIKFLTGTAEVLTGLALTFLSAGQLRSVVDRLTREERHEDPNDLAVRFIRDHLGSVLDGRHTLGMGLLVLGAVKLIGGYGLLKRVAWGYHVLVVTVGLLLPFDLYGAVHRGTITSLILLTLNLTIFVLLLVYRKRLVSHAHGPATIEESGS